MVKDDPEEYRRNEKTCRLMAGQAATLADRTEWLKMADDWSHRAAETAAKATVPSTRLEQ